MVTAGAAYGAFAASAMVGGFVVDRQLADSPSRVYGRLPDLARPRERDSRDPKLDGTVQSRLLLWAPIAAAAFGAISIGIERPHHRIDVIWHRHPLGIAVLGGTLGAASIAAGVVTSRTALG